MTAPIVEVRDISFGWQSEGDPILRIPELNIDAGERVFIRGPSGSGKSTLLALLGGMMPPRSGDITILGQPVSDFSQSERDRFRADHIGFVFQMFNLIPYLNIIQNVTLPCLFSEKRRQQASKQTTIENEAVRILNHLSLTDVVVRDRKVTDLSVGQQQRVAVARAMLGSPEIIIADEPTSALDTDLRDAFLRLLMDECADSRMTLMFVSHDGGLAHHFDRVLDLEQINQLH